MFSLENRKSIGMVTTLRRAFYRCFGLGCTPSFVLALCVTAHSVLDVVVNDEVQFRFGEAVVPCQNGVDFVDDWLAGFGVNRINKKTAFAPLRSISCETLRELC